MSTPLVVSTLLAAALVASTTHVSAASFNYTDTNWEKQFATCKGLKQSPVNIETTKTRLEHGHAFKLSESCKLASGGKYTVENTGHTYNVVLLGDTPCKMTKSDGSEWKMLQMHHHTRSEHTINGVAYPLTAHIVFQNTKDDKKLSVIGVIMSPFSVNEVAAASFTDEVLENVPHTKNQKIERTASKAFDLGMGLSGKSYFAYSGSLTTPPCSEVVAWVVTSRVAKIKQATYDKYRNNTKYDFKESGMINHRPVQAINSREIIYYTANERDEAPFALAMASGAAAASVNALVAFAAVLVAALAF